MLTGTLAAFMVGRFSATFLMKYMKPGNLMGLYSIANIVLVGIGILFPGWIGVWSVFLTSFFMSLMFPTIYGLGIAGLGNDTKIGGAGMVMAIAGAAVLTQIQGIVSDQVGSIKLAYWVPAFAFVVVGFYGAYVCCKRESILL